MMYKRARPFDLKTLVKAVTAGMRAIDTLRRPGTRFTKALYRATHADLRLAMKPFLADPDAAGYEHARDLIVAGDKLTEEFYLLLRDGEPFTRARFNKSFVMAHAALKPHLALLELETDA